MRSAGCKLAAGMEALLVCTSQSTALHLAPVPQMITLMQTLVLGFVLAALFSDIQMTAQGVQDELGVSAQGWAQLTSGQRWLQAVAWHGIWGAQCK